MEFYRIEYLLKNFEEFLDEEDKQYKRQTKDQEKKYQEHKPSQSQLKPPSMGSSYGNFKLPKFDVPKIKPPSF